MAYRIERSDQSRRDLQSIFDFLFESAISFGEPPDRAFARASKRIQAIDAALHRIAKKPHQGTLVAHLLPGLRCITKERAVFYLLIDEEQKSARVLAVFFGGQDHQRAMAKRIVEGE